MVQYAKGNMFDHPADIYIATTNSFIKRDKTLCMGAGAAKELAKRFPNIPRMAGRILFEYHLQDYGCIIFPSTQVGLFQTKRHFKDPSPIDLIIRSTQDLKEYADRVRMFTIHLNYPGINHGGLTREAVYPIIEELPDNVIVWSF